MKDLTCDQCGKPFRGLDKDDICSQCEDTNAENEPAILCSGDGAPDSMGCGRVVLSNREYIRQLKIANKTWRCPNCSFEAKWAGTGSYE